MPLPWPRTGRRRGAARGLAPRSTIRWPCHVGFSMHYRSERPDLIKACVINYNNYSAILDWNRSEILKRKARKKSENAMKILYWAGTRPVHVHDLSSLLPGQCGLLAAGSKTPRGSQVRKGQKKDGEMTGKDRKRTAPGPVPVLAESWPPRAFPVPAAIFPGLCGLLGPVKIPDLNVS